MDTIKRWMKNGRLSGGQHPAVLLGRAWCWPFPFLMAGSIALVLNSFPVSGYQAFLDGFLGEGSGTCSSLIYNSTLNALSLLLLVTISYNYGRNRDGERAVLYPLVAPLFLCGLCVKGEETAPLEIFSPPWLFTAIVVALVVGPVPVPGQAQTAAQPAVYRGRGCAFQSGDHGDLAGGADRCPVCGGQRSPVRNPGHDRPA